MSKILVETYGCQMNVSDSEKIISKLRGSGYDITATPEEADVIIINTCSIRSKAEHKVYSRIGEITQTSKRPLVGLMGCVAQLEGDRIFEHASQVAFVVGTGGISRISQVVERVLNGEKNVLDIEERAEEEDWDISPLERHSKYVAFIPIIEGCNKFCTYCIVPYSRGREKSRPADEIINEVLLLKAQGYKEIQLIGQNVNSYRPLTERGLEQYSGATSFSKLLRAVAATDMPRIKFTTSFPRDFHSDIVAAIEENDNLCNWVHLPVQSGNDRILKSMRRGYKTADYLRRIEPVLNSKRDIALTSDVIVGFPGESYQDFEDTLKLVEQCQFHGLYIFKYSQRNGTPASNLSNDIPEDIKTSRFLNLEILQRNIQKGIYEGYVGKSVSVLVEGLSARSADDLTGHTTCNKVVNFRGSSTLVGSIVNVGISEAKTNSLYGTLK